MGDDFQAEGRNPGARFHLTLHRDGGMTLVAMDWKGGRPLNSLVDLVIEYEHPRGHRELFAGIPSGFTQRSARMIGPRAYAP